MDKQKTLNKVEQLIKLIEKISVNNEDGKSLAHMPEEALHLARDIRFQIRKAN